MTPQNVDPEAHYGRFAASRFCPRARNEERHRGLPGRRANKRYGVLSLGCYPRLALHLKTEILAGCCLRAEPLTGNTTKHSPGFGGQRIDRTGISHEGLPLNGLRTHDVRIRLAIREMAPRIGNLSVM